MTADSMGESKLVEIARIEAGLDLVRRIVESGTVFQAVRRVEDEKPIGEEVVKAQEAINVFMSQEGGRKERFEASLRELDSEQLTRVIRKSILDWFILRKEAKAEQLNEYEKDKDQKNLNFAMMVMILNRSERFVEARQMIAKISDDTLRQRMEEITEKAEAAAAEVERRKAQAKEAKEDDDGAN